MQVSLAYLSQNFAKIGKIGEISGFLTGNRANFGDFGEILTGNRTNFGDFSNFSDFEL